MNQSPVLVVFLGAAGASPPEELLWGAYLASTLDLLEAAQRSGSFDKVLLVTNRPELAREAGGSLQVEVDRNPFHFGERLREIVCRHRLDRVLYLGGGSLPLIAPRLRSIAGSLARVERAVITNNLFSSDLAAFHPGSALEEIEPPASDNALAQSLRLRAGLRPLVLPRSLATLFDLDTPTDLLVLKLLPNLGPRLRRYVSSLKLDSTRLETALKCFADPQARVLVAGRVGSFVWSRLERGTACQVRLFSEERGMRADGREEKGTVRSLLGLYLEQVGTHRFFQTLGELADAAFLDSRVLFHHLHLNLSQADRFYSDLGEVEKIQNPYLREFTREALAAPIPVVLGGHSLMAGGLLALARSITRP